MKEPRRTIVIEPVPSRASETQTTREAIARRQPRTESALQLLATRVAENVELMQRLRSIAGSEDRARTSEVTREIIAYAQTLDPTVSVAEGTTIVIALARMIGHFPGEGEA